MGDDDDIGISIGHKDFHFVMGDYNYYQYLSLNPRGWELQTSYSDESGYDYGIIRNEIKEFTLLKIIDTLAEDNPVNK